MDELFLAMSGVDLYIYRLSRLQRRAPNLRGAAANSGRKESKKI